MQLYLYNWMKKDLGSVNRSITSWVVFAGQRPMYSSVKGGLIPSVDTKFVKAVEPHCYRNTWWIWFYGDMYTTAREHALFIKVYSRACLAKMQMGLMFLIITITLLPFILSLAWQDSR